MADLDPRPAREVRGAGGRSSSCDRDDVSQACHHFADGDEPVTHTPIGVPPRRIGEILRPFQSGPTRGEPQAGTASESLSSPTRGTRPLDAWSGQYTNDLLRALVSQGEGVHRLMSKTVIDDDDRRSVDTTQEYPFTCICDLMITAASGRVFSGTGWLLNPHTVVTAGHCLYQTRQGGWARRIDLFQGRHGNTSAASATATEFTSVRGWVRDALREHDYGCLRLDRPIAAAGSLGFGCYPDQEIRRFRCHVVGYPIDKASTMWGQLVCFARIDAKRLTYETPVYGGSSGAPVFVVKGGDCYVAGIHASGDLSGIEAVRITDSVFRNLASWKAE